MLEGRSAGARAAPQGRRDVSSRAPLTSSATVTNLPIQRKREPAAPTRAEAVEAHLAGAIAEADRDLERRRRDLPEPEPTPPPMDPATRRFLGDG